MSPSATMAKECDSKRIDYVSLYKPKFSASTGGKKRGKWGGGRVKLYNVAFFVMYVYQVYWCISTIGQPYREFLEKADREGFQVMEGQTKMRAQLHHALSDLNDENRPAEKVGWFDWMSMDIEEHAERKKRDKEQTVLDSLPKRMRVPGRYAMAFTPCLILGILVTIHALVILLQVWSVGFNVWLNYREVDVVNVEVPEEMLELDEDDEDDEEGGGVKAVDGTGAKPNDGGTAQASKKKDTIGERILKRAANQTIPSNLPTHVRVTPAKGRDVLVPLLYLPTLGLTFEYHRRRYVYSSQNDIWTKIRCRTTMPTIFFSTWNGFTSPQQIMASQIRFGSNIFDVKQPTFTELYKAQLLSPFTVFQLFCVILWMLDDYWQYSFFTLFMILMFEGTVVFSRIKSLGALRGMGNKSRSVLVYRMGRWTGVDSTEVLPGDVMSLTRLKPHYVQTADAASSDKKPLATTKSRGNLEDEDGDVVPADVLLLRGSTVVNEASLTGESVPQMKEGISELMEGDELQMKGKHKTHVLYAGTKMLQCKGIGEVMAEEESSEEEEEEEKAQLKDGDDNSKVEKRRSSSNPTTTKNLYGDIPNPPDNGCLTFVLRTGFSSAQGKLVRMIEGSQEKVKGHERETGLLLLLLFCFAVASSSYVLYHGLHDDNRSQYELLLHCILIITSVIPPELPMQMALAVNNSLMTLMKMQVFCTEPYRVPIAGKLDSCLFDKTGTLTTDELVAVGVCEPKGLLSLGTTKGGSNKSGKIDGAEGDSKEEQLLTPMTKITNEAALVLAGCHSLVLIEGDTTGDPLESAALSAMRWRISDKTGHVIPSPATEKKSGGKPISLLSGNSRSGSVTEVEVMGRHHFSSKLQRMSTVIKDVTNKRHFAVVKGSPEAIGKLLTTKPPGYDGTAKVLSKRGYRVIALGLKPLNDNVDVESARETRVKCEENIAFAGFIAFTCRVRKDTKMVLKKLREGGMSIAMVTGDALLTAAHVAKEVDICDSTGEEDGFQAGAGVYGMEEKNDELKALLESKKKNDKSKSRWGRKKPTKEYKPILILEKRDEEEEKDDGGGSSITSMYWQSYDDESKVDDFVAKDVPELAKRFDLATTGKSLAAAFEYDEDTRKVLAHFKIFARMTPDAKETVIECLHSVGSLCLMCGDGANDVGALKQADVGVALLSGFGDVNVDKGEDGNKKDSTKKKDSSLPTASDAGSEKLRAIMTQEEVNMLRQMPVRLIKMKIRQIGVDPDKYPDLVEKEDLIKLYQIKSREVAVKRHEKKNKMETNKAKQRELMAEKQRKMALRVQELEAQGEQWAQWKAMKEFWAEQMEENKKVKAEMAKSRTVEGSAASIAAQLEDLEMDELPMVKLGDASIAAPFTSKMPSIRSCVDIIRQGRCTLVTSIQMYQILALNCLISAYSLSVLYLDGVKYGDVQMTAMGMLMSVSYMSVSRAKPLDKLSSVRPLTSIFHPSLFISLLGQFAVHLVTMVWAVGSAKEYLPDDYKVDLDGEFKPGIVNSVVFLVSNVQQVTVFVVNLQGRPFMSGLTENRPLLWSLLATFILTFMFASESVPGLNKYFQLVPFPDEAFRDFILKILAGDVIVSFCFDRLMKLLFCPKILFASVEGTTVKDVMGLARTIGVILAIMYMFLGNDEQWEEMLREEGRLDEMEDGTNGTNATNVTAAAAEIVADVVSEAAKACVGAACGVDSSSSSDGTETVPVQGDEF